MSIFNRELVCKSILLVLQVIPPKLNFAAYDLQLLTIKSPFYRRPMNGFSDDKAYRVKCAILNSSWLFLTLIKLGTGRTVEDLGLLSFNFAFLRSKLTSLSCC
jgi:hypothetical protein